MFSQIKRAAGSFGVILLTYWLYAFAIVPWIEPESQGPARVHAMPSQDYRSTDAFKNEIRNLFPENAWEMGDSKILRSGNASLLFQDYNPKPDGTVHIFPCTVVIRSAEDGKNGQPPLILQAPEGAVLRLNRPLDLKSAQVGRPVEGRLLGQIRIHSPGRSDGTGKLELLTSNVQIDSKRLWTPHDVSVTFDRSRANGRDLMIQLAPRTRSRTQASGWAGIQSIDLVQLDELYMEIDEKPDAKRANKKKAIATNVPVTITCAGQFRIDFLQNVVTFEDQVHLRRLNPDAAEDSLRCERLTLYLISEERDDKPADGKRKIKLPNGKRNIKSAGGKQSIPRLDPYRVVAEGNPATLNAPSKKVFIRGRSLYYNLKNRRFRLGSSESDPADQVLFRHESHEIYARELSAEMSVDKSLEKLRAAGPGRYRGIAPGSSAQSLEAAWGDALVVDRAGKGHVLTLNESALVRINGDQRVQADKIQLWFEMAPGAQPDSGELSRGFRPQRIAAVGPSNGVFVSSPQLRARTSQLELLFQHPAPRQRQPSAPRVAGASPRPASVGASERSRTAPAARADGGLGGSLVNPRQTPSGQVIDISSARIHLIVQLVGKQAHVQQVDLVGQARLKRARGQLGQDGDFEVAAETIRVRDQNGQGQHLVIARGRPVDIRSDKLSMQSAEIQLDLSRNLMWTDGAGRMKIMLDRDLEGRVVNDPRPLTIDWRDRMDFNGKQVDFLGSVDVRTADQRMRSSRMEVHLTERIDFSKSRSGRKVDIQHLRADGNVLIENRDVPNGLVMSVTYMQVPHLRIDRNSGDAFAAGPGRVVTHRRGFSGGIKLPGKAAVSKPTAADPRVTFTQIDYQGQLVGNFLRRAAAFKGQVQIVYGPVLSWNETIDADRSLGKDDVLLSCDQLSFVQGGVLPTEARSVNMVADGNTYVEGQTFTARGQRISFEQAKDLLILEGTTRTDAVLSHQSRVGAPRSETAARKILYWTLTGNVEVDDARYVDLSNLGL